MKIKNLLLICTAILITNKTSKAQFYSDTTTIDINLTDCLATGENQTTYGMIQCIDTAYAAWDVELNKYYKLLMTVLTEEEKEKLKTAQKAWITMRDADIAFIGLYSENLEGSMYRVSANYHTMEIMRLRALQLRSFYTEIMEVRQ
ncbi:MAG: DUF1311 domain-containing protein [Chitinophagales bacterium]|jgi:uncharacterized protein YecT (DUF1311 family)|nr:DUF1311 domain-containing protein [Chitinophagales bacterium]